VFKEKIYVILIHIKYREVRYPDGKNEAGLKVLDRRQYEKKNDEEQNGRNKTEGKGVL